MVHISNYICNYYEDNNYKLIELNLDNENIVLGLIKGKYLFPFNKIHRYISKLQKNMFSNIIFPIIDQNSKVNMEAILSFLNLGKIYNNIDISNIYDNLMEDKNMNVSFCMNQIKMSLIFNNNSSKKQLTNEKSEINNNFILDTPFYYYIMYKPLQLLLFVGFFC